MDVDQQKEDQALLRKDVAPAQNSTKERLKFKKLLLAGNLILLRFFGNVCGTLPSPFFARVMKSKSGTVFEAALSTRIRLLSFVICSTVYGRYYSKFGTKRLLWFGIFGPVFAQVLFGLLEFVNDLTIIVIGAIVTRILYGALLAAHRVAANVILLQEYPDRISLLFGALQGAAGCGYMLGPGLGGILYNKFGMAVPILGSAAILLLCGLFSCCLIQAVVDRKDSDRIESDSDISMRTFISKPLVIATLLLTCSIYGVASYTDVALTLYFQDAGRSTTLAGVALLFRGGAFAGVSPIIGYCAGKSKYVRRFSISIAAILFSGLMFAFIPNQFLSVIYVCCAGLGLFCGMSNVPSLEFLLVIANNGPVDKNSNSAMYGAIMGIWQSTMGLGVLVSPIIASFIQSETSLSFT